MGLALAVGILADLKANDEEGYRDLKEQFAAVNTALAALHLGPHAEPEHIDAWSCDMWGYSGLHDLRRVAAYEAFEYDIPTPGTGETSRDPVVVDYYRETTGSPFAWLRRLFRGPEEHKALPFQHLMLHSDAEGFYLPIEFEKVIFPDASFDIAGGMIGSSCVLWRECERLAELLGIPPDLDPESEDLWQAAENQGQGDGEERWRRYGVESFTCLRLMAACEASMRTGAAIVFT